MVTLSCNRWLPYVTMYYDYDLFISIYNIHYNRDITAPGAYPLAQPWMTLFVVIWSRETWLRPARWRGPEMGGVGVSQKLSGLWWKNHESLTKLDDLGLPPFWETYGNLHFRVQYGLSFGIHYAMGVLSVNSVALCQCEMANIWDI